MFLGKFYCNKQKHFQSNAFLKKALCNVIWVLQSLFQKGGDKMVKKVRSVLKYTVFVFLNFYVMFLQKGSLEQVE